MSDERKAAWDLVDRETNQVRVMAAKCSTCIFHKGNPMYLEQGRLKDIIDQHLETGALLTCHKSLPYNEFGIDPTACEGFWSAYGLQTTAGRFARFVMGIIRINPPWESHEEAPVRADRGRA